VEGATPCCGLSIPPSRTGALAVCRPPGGFLRGLRARRHGPCGRTALRRPGPRNQHSGDGFTGLGYARFFGHADLARLLLDGGADPSLAARNPLRVAPLHSAVATGNPAVVELLLASGANPNAEEGSGMTPLHTAAGHGNRQVIALLIAAGAQRMHKTHDGRTPADIARHYCHAEVAVELEGAAKYISVLVRSAAAPRDSSARDLRVYT
jgi:hypothetical protein